MARKITLTKTHVLKANEFQETSDFPDQNVPFVYDSSSTTKKYIVKVNSIAEGQTSMFYDKINGDLDVASIVEEEYTNYDIINYNSEVYWTDEGDTNMDAGDLLYTFDEPLSNISSVELNLWAGVYYTGDDPNGELEDDQSKTLHMEGSGLGYSEVRASSFFTNLQLDQIGEIYIVFTTDSNGNLWINNFFSDNYDDGYQQGYRLKVTLESIRVNYNS